MRSFASDGARGRHDGLAAITGVRTSTLTGVVRDASGGVLPGVTVEAASPALTEKSEPP